MLTTLGIIFGVAAVIAMMAIGQGAQKEILDQMKLVGVNNIIVVPKIEKANKDDKEKNSEPGSTDTQQGNKESGDIKKYSPGLTLDDAMSFRTVIPSVDHVCPEVIYETNVVRNGKASIASLTGVTPDFFKVFNLEISQGVMFTDEQIESGKPVCIIGPAIKSKFFPSENPLGKVLKCGPVWLMVTGILKQKETNTSNLESLGISDYNGAIFTPIKTQLLRFRDRSLINAAALQGGMIYYGPWAVTTGEETELGKSKNQIDKIVLQVKGSEWIKPTENILKRMLLRRHNGVEDFEIKIPELLLKQQQRTKNIFNIVLGAIASISLLVGGIGIMNIMLASVMERIKEIGIRQAMGATKKDIVLQFLSEATLLSLSGGLIGIIVGIVLSKLIMHLAGILTIVSLLSIFVSFGVSATVGIVFGYMPAKRASAQDPVASLRYE